MRQRVDNLSVVVAANGADVPSWIGVAEDPPAEVAAAGADAAVAARAVCVAGAAAAALGVYEPLL